MTQPVVKPRQAEILIPEAPVIVATALKCLWLSPQGEIEEISHRLAAASLQNTRPIVCHAPLTAQRLGMPALVAFDVLELYAFVHPAKFCVPTPAGLAKALGLETPGDAAGQCLALLDAVRALLADLRDPERREYSDASAIAREMEGWPWRSFILQALGVDPKAPADETSRRGLKVWERLPEWSENAPDAAPGHHPVTADEAEIRLSAMKDENSESRPQQIEYTRRISAAFAPVQQPQTPHLVLAEAGTGVGKTLGYLAPSTVWAEKNKGAVWVSTYTKNLQQQVQGELENYYDTPHTLEQKVAVRKGRDNYLCLLNLEDAVQNPARKNNTPDTVSAGLIARWTAATKTGDFSGDDFQGWLVTLLGRGRTLGLADQRGECIYAACNHFHRCFVEKSVRKAKRADIVIANHALVMRQAAMSGPETDLPFRYVFDEGHHIFDAADSAFSAHLTGFEAAELRRWILGAEEGRRSRARGLKRRVEDLVEGDEAATSVLDSILQAARVLPEKSWPARVHKQEPRGSTEEFLSLVHRQVYARAKKSADPYTLECGTQPLIDGLSAAAERLEKNLAGLRLPMQKLAAHLLRRLEDQAETMEKDTRLRIEAVSASLSRRSLFIVKAWEDMLKALREKTPPEFVDFLSVERINGRDSDIGMHRHWVDPGLPLAASLKTHAHGITVTSATLKDGPDGWQNAQTRSGFRHLNAIAQETEILSPFDYAAQTRIIVITDINRDSSGQIAAACRALFIAAGGGALGLFTSIQRLRTAHKQLAPDLEKAGIALYAQHMDGLDTGTLIDIFRAEENACLLGTDATRDGVDVPGKSLRLIAFDRVPWPRPSLVHKARSEAFGKGYTDMLTRLKIKQAYGRLIRRQSDKGVFIMLDSRMPSRLCDAFPEGVEIQRIGLAEAVRLTQEFLS